MFWLSLLTALVAACFVSWRVTLYSVNAVLAAFYLGVTLYKLRIILASTGADRQVNVPAEEIAALDRGGLPSYTILVPLFREADVLPDLVNALEGLEYPRERLQILLLLEETDRETIDAAERLELAAPFETLIVPDSYPRTKPKACNVGLAHTTGDFVVIYDAEDRPEPDQLLKTAAAFRRLPDEVVCLQAKLNFYNRDQNLLTRWFTVDYSTWFDLYLPGLGRIDAPIPLGGTSNHFKRRALLEFGGWDPWNVAEDCDLGMRLYKKGYRTRVLNSTTWEEACSSLRYWVRQRSRWIKGYLQTFLVHTRHPWRDARAMGPRRYLDFLVLTGGVSLTVLVNPLYWALALVWVFFRAQAVGAFFPPVIFILAFFCLFVGNFALVYAGMLGCCSRRYYGLVLHALLIPPYWVLMSVAAWKALWQLMTRPHYWEKTRHGLVGMSPAEGGGRQEISPTG